METMPKAKPRKRAGNTASIIYDELRGQIPSGQLASGVPISSASVARARGASRAPVRETLRRLQQDRLVVARANQRFHVTPSAAADLEAALSLHLVNIALSIRVGVQFLGDADIDALKTHVSSMDRAARNDPGAWAASARADDAPARFDVPGRLALKARTAAVVEHCKDTLNDLVLGAGANAFRAESKMQMIFWDINMISVHAFFEKDGAMEGFGRVMPGLPPDGPV